MENYTFCFRVILESINVVQRYKQADHLYLLNVAIKRNAQPKLAISFMFDKYNFISAFMHIFGDMPGNIISRAGFSQPFVISLLHFLMTASAVKKMALGLLEITENHGSQHLSLVY